MKIQIKTDEVSKDTKNHLKFKKKLRKVLMQRDENKFIADNWTKPTCIAYNCPNCKKIVIDYADGNNDLNGG